MPYGIDGQAARGRQYTVNRRLRTFKSGHRTTDLRHRTSEPRAPRAATSNPTPQRSTHQRFLKMCPKPASSLMLRHVARHAVGAMPAGMARRSNEKGPGSPFFDACAMNQVERYTTTGSNLSACAIGQ